MKHNGKAVDIVAQPTKFGLLYVFNRVTGEPIWPIEERAVPQSDMPGEQSWPTQPFPTKPPPFSRLHFTEKDINPVRRRGRAASGSARSCATRATRGSSRRPASRTSIQAPGQLGGSNWGGTAGDPATGFLYVRAVDLPSTTKLSERRDRAAPFRLNSLLPAATATLRRRSRPSACAKLSARGRADARVLRGHTQ